MVNPMILVALFLFSAFLIALADKLHRKASLGLMYLTLLTALGMSLYQAWCAYMDPVAAQTVVSAGFNAPLSIALRFGLSEALLLSLLNGIGVLGGVYLFRKLNEQGAQPIALYMLVLLGANGLVLTRDIFNSFVFLEILSIATYSFIGLEQNKNSLAAGLKYMFAGGISSAFYLVGIVMAYRYTGTLNIDTWIAGNTPLEGGYLVALFLLSAGLFLETKPFPANGWALDLYQSASSGVGAIVASVNTGALLYMFYKLMPIMDERMLGLFTGAGLFSFVLSNLVALRQKDVKRLLGYSSTAQAGLVIFTLGSLTLLNIREPLILFSAFAFFLTNALAKSGLFWLSGIVKETLYTGWGIVRKNTGLLTMLALLLLALMSVPPFPGFFAKWKLVQIFARTGNWVWLSGLLLGSLFEAAYLLRWLGWAAKGETEKDLSVPAAKTLAVIASTVVLCAAGIFIAQLSSKLGTMTIYPVLALLIMGLLDFLSAKLKGIVTLGLIGAWAYQFLLPGLSPMKQLFALILVGGAMVQVITFMHRKGRSEGIFPALTMLIVALGNVLLAHTRLELFMAWEFMTFASYLMILRGGKARIPAYVYGLFSTAGAYLILAGLNYLPELSGGLFLLPDGLIGTVKVGALLAIIGFLIKTGALGVHYWLPGAYAESEDDTTAVLSSVLSKAGIYGLFLILSMLVPFVTSSDLSMEILLWVGILTAFIGALMAVFQEDAKLLLAYSSMSQLGYIVAGFALMSHLGWVSALYLAVNHLLFKGLIFIAMAAVFLRTGTRNMYEMGGLIKKMPIAYMSVLLGIIAASGVPPLSGFGSKWFIYTSLLEQGKYLAAGLAFFSSAIAFLYLYKLIHTVFLGQAKPNQKDVKEAPIWLIIPQGIFMMSIMAVSMFPNLITIPLSRLVGDFIPKPYWINWDGYNLALTSGVITGNWNGNLIMFVTMGVFMVPLAWLMLVNARVQKVKQFNIVFAAERPFKPWTTHFAYNMFAHYNKALGFLVEPRATAFYKGLAEGVHAIAATISRLYTGNGQTYMLHLYLYTIVLYLLLGVK